MKKILLVLFCALITLHVNAQETTPSNAQDVLDKAMASAEASGKNVFVMFHASWCGWCKRMDKRMMSEATKSMFEDNYVIEHLTVLESPANKTLENPGGAEVLEKYKGTKAGLPFWLIISPKGELLSDAFNDKGANLGCPATPEEVDGFIDKLKATSSLTDADLKVIHEVFIAK